MNIMQHVIICQVIYQIKEIIEIRYRHAKCSEMKKITESEAFRLAALAGKCYGLRESFRDKYIYQSDRNHEYEIDAAKDINSDCEIYGNNIKKAKEEAAREKAAREKLQKTQKKLLKKL